MNRPGACDDCLRRAWLVAGLADRIEAGLGSARREARELLALEDERLAEAVAAGDAERILETARAADTAAAREAVERTGLWASCRHDAVYPGRLRDARDAPAVLFGRGSEGLLRELSEEPAVVTIVGTRRPSAHGRDLAESLGARLARAGAVIVSGMAHGIDSASHEGALSAAGRTVAVLGGGAEIPSPRGQARVYRRIANEGLIVSELPPGTAPRRWTFPARNRIMAALGRMTVVVEARSRSGSLITAAIAQDLGRDVGAVPGRVGDAGAEGTNELLRAGAHVVRGPEDVLDALLGAGAGRATIASSRGGSSLEPELAAVLAAVSTGSASCDEVARTCELGAPAAASALVRLELAGLVRSDSAGRYRLPA